jgi:hypothetical protein
VPWDKVKDRDGRYGVSTEEKREKRAKAGIKEVKIHEDADGCWK